MERPAFAPGFLGKLDDPRAVYHNAGGGRVGVEHAVHEVPTPSTHVHHALELGPRAVGHHGGGAEGVQGSHGAAELVFGGGVRFKLGPEPALLERVLGVGQVPRDGARRVGKHLGKLAPRVVHVFGVVADESLERIRVVFAQHRGERGVHELRAAVGCDWAELEHAVGRARVQEALHDGRFAAHGLRQRRRGARAAGEDVRNLHFLSQVHEHGLVVGHRHVEHFDGRRREGVRHGAKRASEHVQTVV